MKTNTRDKRASIGKTSLLFFTSLVLFVLAPAALAGDWPGWRGPNGDGSTDEKKLPEKWSQTENIAWSAEMPGLSAATPIIKGRGVFTVSTIRGSDALLALCHDRDSGDLIWKKEVAKANRSAPNNTMSTPSPCVDAQRVYYLFGTGALAALDAKTGEPVWKRDLEEKHGHLSLKYGYSSSPFLHDGKIFVLAIRNVRPYSASVQVDKPLESYLLCVDAATGDDVYKHIRPSDAIEEGAEAYTTPILMEVGGSSQIVVNGADYVTGHDPATGAELWRQAYTDKKWEYWRLVPSLVSGAGLVYGVQPRGGHYVYAFRPGEKGSATKSFSEAVWTAGKGEERDKRGEGTSPDVCSPLFYRDRLYVLDGRTKTLLCYDPKTGREIWRGDIGGATKYYASPTAGDGKIYCIDMKGEAVTVAAGDSFQVLSRASMGGGPNVASSISIAGGKLFVRTDKTLFCVGK